jgi:hypothetical protein
LFHSWFKADSLILGGIRLNWVLVIAGLIPLWAALFIVFTNMRVLKDDTTTPELAQTVKEKAPEPVLSDEFIDEQENTKGIFSGLLGRFKKKDEESSQDLMFTEKDEETSALGLPRGLKRLWGVTFILIFIACLAYGSEKGLDYLFKEYRWTIGTTNPWTAQLQFASVSTTAIAGFSAMIATFKTGLYLLKH